MARHLTLPQITLLVALALGVAAFLVLIFYLLHRAVREHQRGLEFKPSTPRPENEPAFVAATVQSLIAELKSRQVVLEERSRGADHRANTAEQTIHAIARSIPQGLLVIGAGGYLILANEQARELLEADVWSRRRFAELFAGTPLAEVLNECMAAGKTQVRESIAHQTPSGRGLTLSLRAEPIESRGGITEGVVCLLWNKP